MKTNKIFLFQAKASHKESEQTFADVQQTSAFDFPVTESWRGRAVCLAFSTKTFSPVATNLK